MEACSVIDEMFVLANSPIPSIRYEVIFYFIEINNVSIIIHCLSFFVNKDLKTNICFC